MNMKSSQRAIVDKHENILQIFHFLVDKLPEIVHDRKKFNEYDRYIIGLYAVSPKSFRTPYNNLDPETFSYVFFEYTFWFDTLIVLFQR